MREKAHRPNPEKGQTILLVAVALVSLLGMAALAIDVVTLYVARSEIQRAADAAALAGAKAIADSGVTTLSPDDPSLAAATTLAQTMSTASINAILPYNLVAGNQPNLVSSLITYPATSNPTNSNPHITVTLQVTNLPTFFAHIWGRTAVTTSASATAEAYNPANINAAFTPISPSSVKPWLVANADPIRKEPFVDQTTWTIEQQVIGETFDLTGDCQNTRRPCNLQDNPPKARSATQVDYVPAQVPDPANAQDVCPTTCRGGRPYEESIECADPTPYAFYQCGSNNTGATIRWSNTLNPGGNGTNESGVAAQCLIHATGSGPGQGQDTLTNPAPWPSGPMQINAQSGPLSGQVVSTSSSIVTIPIIEVAPQVAGLNLAGGPVTIVGYLQAFINGVEPGFLAGTTAGDIDITVLNVVGCSPNATNANPVVGGTGTSPIPVRLITPP
jgi:Putative Flp pilus-assembly TadE/G-like